MLIYIICFQELFDRESDEEDVEIGQDAAATEMSKFKLHVLSHRGDLECVKELIEEEELSPLMKDKNGRNALHYASGRGHVDMMKYFVENKQCSVTRIDDEGWTPLHYAARYNHLKLVQYLINKPLLDPLCQALDGSTPLHTACAGGSIEVVEFLINKMGEYLPLKFVASIHNRNKSTPIHIAAGYKHFELVQYLIIEQRVDPLCWTSAGDLPLHKHVWVATSILFDI